MARRLGRRKAPLREDYMLKEEQVDSGSFNEKTMIYLSKFYNQGIIEKLGFTTARGKEADVYVANAGTSEKIRGKYVIVKFYRVETPSFVKMANYLVGDPRFTRKINRKKKMGVIIEWCKKEYGNLELAARAGVHAPVPYMFNGTILAMEFIGDDDVPAPQLKHIELKDPEKTLKQILSDIRGMYRKKLVHADVSEYNILIKGKEQVPYFIDFGQGVVLEHPNAIDFLERDVKNIVSYFKKRYGADITYEKALKEITS